MAELTFKTNIRREHWPRWMTELHEYLTRVYVGEQPEPKFEDYERLKRIILGKLRALKENGQMKRAEVSAHIVSDSGRTAVFVVRKNLIVTSYYIE